jgi:hypothetical protein
MEGSTGKPNPRICFLLTATVEAGGYVMRWFETCDIAFLKAWENGIVTGWGSPGSLCWFEQGTTDSRPGQLTTVEGLALSPTPTVRITTAKAKASPLYWSKIKLVNTNQIMPVRIKPPSILKMSRLNRSLHLTRKGMPALWA